MTHYVHNVRSIDSHTAGEPTRVIIEGGPDLGSGSLAQRREVFRDRFDRFRSAVVNEPRGSDVLVGALLCEPVDPQCAAGVIFFNNVGYLNMCGHGTIGLVATLAYLGKMPPGEHRIETPVGMVTTWLHESGEVTLRKRAQLPICGGRRSERGRLWTLERRCRLGRQLVLSHAGPWLGSAFRNLERLTDCARQIRHALNCRKITGANGEEIDHIELFGPPTTPGRQQELRALPRRRYDRSPCGTGTSAKLACLHADGKLPEGRTWRQESIIGSVFEGTVQRAITRYIR